MDTNLGVVYVRVSSDTQVQNGSGLQGQETSCIEYAKAKNIEVVRVFSDGGVSGRHLSREALDAMIAYLRQENKNYTKISSVIVDDIDRISRDVVNRWNLKASIESTGAQLIALKQNLDDTPEGILQQNIVMSFKQYDRQSNARRVKDRQRARMLEGYRPLYPAYGYKHFKDAYGKKVLDFADNSILIIKEGLELFAKGVFVSREHLRAYFNKQGLSGRRVKSITPTFMDRLFSERVLLFYAGYIHYPDRDVHMIPAKHPSIIDKSMVYTILERLTPKMLYKRHSYSDIDERMPLRSVVTCGCCGHLLTGGPSTSKSGRLYYYYTCRQKSCPEYAKSISADKIHNQLGDIIKGLSIESSVLELLREVVSDITQSKEKTIQSQEKVYKHKLADIQKQIDQIEQRIMSSQEFDVISFYEKKLADLLKEKKIFEGKFTMSTEGVPTEMKSLFENVKSMLENPYSVWENVDVGVKRMMLGVLFSSQISCTKKSGVRTPEIPLIYRHFASISPSKTGDLEMMGFEPMSQKHI